MLDAYATFNVTEACLRKSRTPRRSDWSGGSGAKRELGDTRPIEIAQLVGAVVGLAGGIFAAMSGAMFTVASWVVANEGARQWLSTAGTVLFLLTIPLIIFGSFCMDWAEKNKPRHGSKVARYEDDDNDQ